MQTNNIKHYKIMNEAYVSLETAKLLKEKGFDSHYSTLFYKKDKLEFYKEERKKYWLQVDEYAAPTLCMAQNWLRETKGIYVWIEPVVGHKWTISFCDLNVSAEESDWIENDIKKEGYPVYKKYEEALENAINMVLKII